VNTETTVTGDTKGWLFYDANCAGCARAAARVERLLAQHGFHLLPLQTPGTPERLGVTPAALLARMHLLTREGRRFAGAEAFIEVGRHVWWARPLVAGTRFPGVIPLLRRLYDWVAAHRHCLDGTCRRPRRRSALAWLPVKIHLLNWPPLCAWLNRFHVRREIRRAAKHSAQARPAKARKARRVFFEMP
jgi:predicted DCC family thiol-disulfide oxidoreductase YuxK